MGLYNSFPTCAVWDSICASYLGPPSWRLCAIPVLLPSTMITTTWPSLCKLSLTLWPGLITITTSAIVMQVVSHSLTRSGHDHHLSAIIMQVLFHSLPNLTALMLSYATPWPLSCKSPLPLWSCSQQLRRQRYETHRPQQHCRDCQTYVQLSMASSHSPPTHSFSCSPSLSFQVIVRCLQSALTSLQSCKQHTPSMQGLWMLMPETCVWVLTHPDTECLSNHYYGCVFR